MLRRSSLLLCSLLLFGASAHAQFQYSTKTLLEGYSLELFEMNADGYMSPLVIVTNVGANDGFFNSAIVPKEDRLHFKFSVKSMMAWVKDDQRSYIATLPTEIQGDDGIEERLFKLALQEAIAQGEVDQNIETATVFGDQGTDFQMPKEFLRSLGEFPDSTIDDLPDYIPLTRGTNQDFVVAAVPQLEIGTWKHTQLLVRYIPAVEFDTAVGDFSFFGVGLKHGFTNWMENPPFHGAIQITYQHSTIKNFIGATQAALEATTDMFAVNLHASRRFGYVEPYVGLSYEHLESEGTYTFTLPKRLSDELGYDIDPQTAYVDLSDDAIKATIGITAHLDPVELNVGAGISKHIILGIGLGVNFDAPDWMQPFDSEN